VVQVLDDGTERPLPIGEKRPMTDDEIHAAALADSDAQPLTPQWLATMKRTPEGVERALNASVA